MPLEIRELVIKTSLSGSNAQAESLGSAENGGVSGQDALIAACVEQVLAILKEKAER